MSDLYPKTRKRLPQAVFAVETKDYYRKTNRSPQAHDYWQQPFTNQFGQIDQLEQSQTLRINLKIIEELQNIRIELQTLNERMSKLDDPLPEVTQTEKITLEKARKIVEPFLKTYFKKCKQVYPSDVADALGLKYETVQAVFALLEKERKLK